jgi:hypothetical protein
MRYSKPQSFSEDSNAKKFFRVEGENAADSQGWTALHFTAPDHDIPIVRSLLAAGADADPVEVTGTTPPWQSVMRSRRDPSVIRDLVQRGADALRKNRSGVSPIDLARSIRYQDAVDLFGGRGRCRPRSGGDAGRHPGPHRADQGQHAVGRADAQLLVEQALKGAVLAQRLAAVALG